MVFIVIIAIVMSIYMGLGIARCCVALLIAKSNNIGDSKGSMIHYAKGTWDMKQERDLGS